MDEDNLQFLTGSGYSPGPANVFEMHDGIAAPPDNTDVDYTMYGYSDPRNNQDAIPSSASFSYDPALVSTETTAPTADAIPNSQTMAAWFGNQGSESIITQEVGILGQQSNTRTLTQDCPSDFLGRTVACIRAFNSNPDPDDEQISRLAKDAGLTVTEMTCWFGLVQKIQRCSQVKATTSPTYVPISPSESRSLTNPDAGSLTQQLDDSSLFNFSKINRPRDQIQTRAGNSSWKHNPRSSQIFSPQASSKRRVSSKKPSDTLSTSTSVASKRARLDDSEKFYPCLECKKFCPASGWYEHLVRVHFPEHVWTCGCKENKDADAPKLWPRWDNFVKHVAEKHGYERSPSGDASMKSRGIEVVGCYHHICGFCEAPLLNRQTSLEHIKNHLDNGVQYEEWTHLCVSNHDLRSHVATDLNYYHQIGIGLGNGPADNDDDENTGRELFHGSYHQQADKSNNTFNNTEASRNPTGNSGGSHGQGSHQSNALNHTDCGTAILSDLDETMLPLKSLRKLGHGGYGVVDEVICSTSKETYARKTVHSRQAPHHTQSYVSQLKNELRILKKLNHPHLIKLIGYYTTSSSFYIIMSPVADINLADYIRRYTSTRSLQRNLFLKWMDCLASAVEYLHSERIQHRDIKPQNVLVKGKDVLLTDLGSAKLLLDPHEVSAGKMIITPMYCAPETVSDGVQDYKADIFSLGCVFTEMYIAYFADLSEGCDKVITGCSSKPYHSRVKEIQQRLKDLEDVHSHVLTAELTSIFNTTRRMLEMEPKKRPAASTLRSSFAASSRCCCAHNTSVPKSNAASGESTILPASESSELEVLWSPSRKPATLGGLPSSPLLDENLINDVPILKESIDPTAYRSREMDEETHERGCKLPDPTFVVEEVVIDPKNLNSDSTNLDLKSHFDTAANSTRNIFKSFDLSTVGGRQPIKPESESCATELELGDYIDKETLSNQKTLLSVEEADVIRNAAALLQVPILDAPGAVGKTHSPSTRLGDVPWKWCRSEFTSLPGQRSSAVQRNGKRYQDGTLWDFEREDGIFILGDPFSPNSTLGSKLLGNSQLSFKVEDEIDLEAIWSLPQSLQGATSIQPCPHSASSKFSMPLIEERYVSQRRGPFRNIDNRRQTAQTRRLTACLRCRMQRIRCIPDPKNSSRQCLTCEKSLTSKLPCLRYRLSDVALFSAGRSMRLKWTRRWLGNKPVDISAWASDKIRTIEVFYGCSSVLLDLEVRKFVPEVGDVLNRYWFVSNGVKKSVEFPCYAVAYMNRATQAHVESIKRYGAEHLQSWLRGKDNLLLKTYAATLEAMNSPQTPPGEAALLEMTLGLWIAIRMTTSTMFIHGSDRLDMLPECDKTSPFYREIPVPPVMQAQIELVVTEHIQVPLQRQILKSLAARYTGGEKRSWFTIYLCNFILLHNYTMIIDSDAADAKNERLRGRYARPSDLNKYSNGANTLLAYWHYYNRNSSPFDSGHAGFPATAGLTLSQTELVRETSQYARSKANEWRLLRESCNYESDFFFISQLFEENWQPLICCPSANPLGFENGEKDLRQTYVVVDITPESRAGESKSPSISDPDLEFEAGLSNRAASEEAGLIAKCYGPVVWEFTRSPK